MHNDSDTIGYHHECIMRTGYRISNMAACRFFLVATESNALKKNHWDQETLVLAKNGSKSEPVLVTMTNFAAAVLLHLHQGLLKVSPCSGPLDWVNTGHLRDFVTVEITAKRWALAMLASSCKPGWHLKEIAFVWFVALQIVYFERAVKSRQERFWQMDLLIKCSTDLSNYQNNR